MPRVHAALAKRPSPEPLNDRKNHRHANDREIFHQRDADHDAAIGCRQLSGVAEKPCQHHRACHGDRRADDEPFRDAPSAKLSRAHRNRQPSVESRSAPPTSATHFTRIRSGIENSTPIENISSTTPTSANTSKVCRSERCGPGVNGLITIPPRTKPRISGSRRRHATSPPMHGSQEYVSQIAKQKRIRFHFFILQADIAKKFRPFTSEKEGPPRSDFVPDGPFDGTSRADERSRTAPSPNEVATAKPPSSPSKGRERAGLGQASMPGTSSLDPSLTGSAISGAAAGWKNSNNAEFLRRRRETGASPTTDLFRSTTVCVSSVMISRLELHSLSQVEHGLLLAADHELGVAGIV